MCGVVMALVAGITYIAKGFLHPFSSMATGCAFVSMFSISLCSFVLFYKNTDREILSLLTHLKYSKLGWTISVLMLFTAVDLYEFTTRIIDNDTSPSTKTSAYR